ncbi:hypothetical protein FSP39_014585 [Pinctada imbricata]|uniref:Uncharacterized protein n=1 Tax=Pinctada imbricata TaxID=66713 RepID=A0AA88Y7B1_PINIB|nr:hypothetical protein FSP39_014585 [Pinctada imbricata]
MLVYAYYRVNGFSLTVDSAVVGTTTDARFVVLLTTSAKQPMGTIKMNVTYGDGQEETKELDSEISNMQGSGYAITHSYTIQGNYTAEFTIYNEIDTMNFTIDVYIWDEVTVTLQSKFIGQVSEDISFDFINPPPTGFTYIIEYGNGDTRTNNDSVWYNAYSESAWTYAYNADGIYNVTMTAWNQFYASVCTYIITIQYPIVEINMTLTPETTKIPIPDGIMDFELTMSKQYTSPTDVLCTFDFQDDKEENVSIAIEFGTPINKRYPYSSSGSRVVNFTCWNLVSTMTKLSNIEIVDFTLQDFGVNYPSPLTMNSTLSEELNENYPKTSNIMKLSHTTANVTFFVHLLECSKLPPDIIFKWEFGDDTPSERGLVSFEKEHVYVERGTFTIQVTIDNNRTGETYAMTTFDIQIGVVQFKVTPQRGEVSVTNFRFDFENDMGGSVSYTFDSPVSVHTTSNKYITHTYNDWGIYQASVLASNGTLTEIAFLEEPVQADYFISDELKVTITNGTGYETESIHLPPGNITITIGAARAISRPYINCSINLGDLINKENMYRYGNITISQSLELDSNYYTLGNHSLRVDCSNFVSNISEAYFIDVHNECYTRDGIFDRQYSSFKTPMKAYTSVDTSLASRMGVKCIEKDASFEWTVDRVEIINETDVLTPLEYRPTFNRGSARFARGSVSQGLLYITLNVSLDGTWMNEFTYLQFIKPAPYAFILGGNKRSLKYMDGFVELDALTESYDSERGYGGNSNLTFIWTCWKVTAGSLDEVEKKFDTERNSLGSCVLDERIRGYATLNFSIGTPTQGYAIFVEVSDGLKSSNFTQFIILKPGDPPSIKITCILNCRDKTAISSPLIMKTVCLDCREDEEILYVWSLWIYNSVSKDYSLVNDLSANTATGVNQPSMKINADFMLPGQKYSLRLDASSTMVGRNGTTNVVTAIMTNFPPQVGSDGGCVPDKTEYQTPTEKVKVDCKKFADEGDLMDQDYDRDLLRNEPLIYLYETKTMRYDDGDEEEVVAELYKGGESSVINLPVQMGDPHYNYSVEMRVLVYDRYGDSCMVYFNFTVRPFQGGVPANGSDTSGIEDMFNSFDKGLNITNAGGNDMAVVRQIGSLASVFAPSSEEDEKTTELSAIVKTAVLSSTGESKQISASDSQQVSRNMETLFKNTAYVSDETAKNGAKICSALIDNIKNITTHSKPFPVEDLKSIEGAIDGTIATIDKILDALLPSDTQVDTSQEPVLDDIYNDLLEKRKVTNNTEIDEDALRQEADDLYKLYKFKYDQMKQKQSTAEESVPNVLNAIESSYNVKLQTTEVGAGPSKIIRPNLELSVEKVTKEILQNRTETPIKGIKLSLDQNDTEAIQGTLDIKQTVFDKPPTIYGDGIASLTSRALQLELSNKSIIPNLSFENKQTAYANRFEPQMTAGDPEQMFYLNFDVKNDDDVALVYVEPDNFDIYNRNTWTLYELYYRAATFPKTSIFSFYKEFSIRDYTEGLGFKVMIPPMKKGQHFLGFKALSVPEPSKRRKRRSVAVDNTTTVAPSNTTNQLINVNVSVVLVTTGCRSWNEAEKKWWSTYFLCDSDATDEYFYMVSVHTGLRKGAGTQSRVNFVLSGEDDDSGVRILSDGVRKGFPTGSVRSFFMGTKYPLGDLTYLRIWHDNSGEGGEQSWYLNKVTVDDPQRHARYTFICERWLAVERDDGQVERVLPVCGRENLLQFNTLFFNMHSSI